jgi:hypothetical protein
MNDTYLINKARRLMQQPRPLPIGTVMELNIIKRQLKEPINEFDEFFDMAIKDMNVSSMWR